MRQVLLYATASATGDNIATYDIVAPTRLVAVQWAVRFTCIVASSAAVILLSRAAASQFDTNNVNDILSLYTISSNFVTSGLAQPHGNFLAPVGVSLRTGDRLALHYQETGTVSIYAYLLLHFDK